MFKGFYNLTSGMLTQGRALDVISNNIGNVATTGYKADRFTASTFEDVLWQHVGNRNKNYSELGEMSWITAPDQTYIDFSQATFDETGLSLDFAIDGSGYFAVETDEGRSYTRNGSFSLDNEGYLTLAGEGRVVGADGEAILLTTDRLDADYSGRLFYSETGGYLGQIGVFAFENEQEQLEKNADGLFSSDAEPAQSQNYRILQGMLERSNADWVEQMTQMITAQRAYQSIAQVLRIYDTLINRTTTDLPKLS